MTKNSLSVRLIFSLGMVAFSSACSSSSPPVPIGSGGSGPAGGNVGTGGGDPGAGGAPASPNSIALGGSWADTTGNTVGIQGAFYILEDAVKEGALIEGDGLVHSDFDDAANPTPGVIDASKFDDTTPAPCISGVAAQVKAADPAAEKPYSEIWGGGIGMNLNEVGGEGSTPMPYDAVAAGVAGFEFTVSGDVQGATVRFKATQAGLTDDFCKTISVVPGQTVKVLLNELEHSCWEPDGVLLDTTKLEAIQWQIVTKDSTAYTITNFCVNSLAWVAQ